MIPNKLQIKVQAPGLNARLLPKVVPIFHRWIVERALGETLVDVADYQHVGNGPGITLIGHESNYHLEQTSTPTGHADRGSHYGLVCFRKRGFTPAHKPLLDALYRTLGACELLERELAAEGKLFDAGSLEIRIADRAPLLPLFERREFVDFVTSRLTPVYLDALSTMPVDEVSLPTVKVSCEKPHTTTSVLARLTELRATSAA